MTNHRRVGEHRCGCRQLGWDALFRRAATAPWVRYSPTTTGPAIGQSVMHPCDVIDILSIIGEVLHDAMDEPPKPLQPCRDAGTQAAVEGELRRLV